MADIGGDLLIESLQDKSTFDAKQQNISGSLSVGLGSQGMISGSLSIDKSKVNSDFASVGEQSGLKAGDGGFDVTVKGDTTLIGAVIASTDKAVEEDKNRFDTGGELAMLDLENKAHYKAESIGVNIGTSISFDGALKPSGSGVGIGSDSGDASSTTQSGISGIAGNKDVRSDDKETGIKPIFDKDKVLSEIEAQKQITQLFGQLAPKAVADFANGQKQALEKQLENELDPEKRAALTAEIDKWKEGGAYRIAMHTAVGGLYGGIEGALGAGSAALFADKLGELQNAITKVLSDAGAGDTLSDLAGKLVSQGAAAGIGAIASGGSSAGAGMGLNVEANNRQLHPTEAALIKKNVKEYAAKRGISEEQAMVELTQQALQQIDSAWDERLGSDNQEAKEFLAQIGSGTVKLDPMSGGFYKLFTADDYQKNNHAIFGQYVKNDTLVREELDLALSNAMLPEGAPKYSRENMTGSDWALKDAASDYANMKNQPPVVQWTVLAELRGTRLEIAQQFDAIAEELRSLPATKENGERRTELMLQQDELGKRDMALLSAAKQQILVMAAGGLVNQFNEREAFEGFGEALALSKIFSKEIYTARIKAQREAVSDYAKTLKKQKKLPLAKELTLANP